MYLVILSQDHNFLCALQCTDIQKHFRKSMKANRALFLKSLLEAQSQQLLKANSNSIKSSLVHLFLSEIQNASYAELTLFS